MYLFLLEEPSRNGPSSHKRLTRNSAASANPNSTSRSSHCRQRTDTLPSRVRKNSLDMTLSEAWKHPKLQRCSICLETLDSSHWIRPSTLCTHEPKACEPCVLKYLVHAITDGLSKILCPEVECREELNYSDIEIHMCGNEEDLTRYNALVAQKELEQHPNFVWCTNGQCGKGQIHYEGAISPLVICYHCHADTCFIHRVPWHNNLTCDQYSKHEEANKASEGFIDMHMKRCPNMGCKRPIEKIDGCDHMTCRRPGGCGYEFCWICLADYGPIRIEGNHKHNTDWYEELAGAREKTGYADTSRIGKFSIADLVVTHPDATSEPSTRYICFVFSSFSTSNSAVLFPLFLRGAA
ncbi:unnamed protein product [Rhizoctonia solani]|uniref:RBR-type E3 ubiquitin transferase n=1 Tax=Rhizoctonia solani TaxID=456999 RepID=A0A8H3CHR1_9AGAM|nr:unnamed protein product [Rhizoctonia solani]